jgi:hypothetical protein
MITKIERRGDEWRIVIDSRNKVTTGWTTNGGGGALITANEGYQLLQFAKALTEAAEDIRGYEWVTDELKRNES